MAKKSKEETEKVEKKEETPFTIMEQIITEGEHQNYGLFSGETIGSYEDEIISTGSVRFDILINGGFRPGMSLFFGDEETGKTAQGLVWGKNWQDKYGDKAWVFYFDAEGRGTKYKIEMSGIDQSRLTWIRGNTGEDIFEQMDKVICRNKKGYRFFFLLDSMDAIITKADKEKTFHDAQKVAGGALLNSVMGKKLSNPIHGGGHHLYMCSQLRTKNIGGMGAGRESASPSGGKSPKFYADITGRLFKGWSDTFIKDGESIIGNKTKIKLTKSYNETTNVEFDLPVKLRHKGGIWREYEAFLMAQEWGWILKSGAWFKFTEMFEKFLQDDKSGLSILNPKGEPTNIQGETSVVKYLEEHPELVAYMEAKVKALAL